VAVAEGVWQVAADLPERADAAGGMLAIPLPGQVSAGTVKQLQCQLKCCWIYAEIRGIHTPKDACPHTLGSFRTLSAELPNKRDAPS
jgi:hypothetical protein